MGVPGQITRDFLEKFLEDSWRNFSVILEEFLRNFRKNSLGIQEGIPGEIVWVFLEELLERIPEKKTWKFLKETLLHF